MYLSENQSLASEDGELRRRLGAVKGKHACMGRLLLPWKAGNSHPGGFRSGGNGLVGPLMLVLLWLCNPVASGQSLGHVMEASPYIIHDWLTDEGGVRYVRYSKATGQEVDRIEVPGIQFPGRPYIWYEEANDYGVVIAFGDRLSFFDWASGTERVLHPAPGERMANYRSIDVSGSLFVARLQTTTEDFRLWFDAATGQLERREVGEGQFLAPPNLGERYISMENLLFVEWQLMPDGFWGNPQVLEPNVGTSRPSRKAQPNGAIKSWGNTPIRFVENNTKVLTDNGFLFTWPALELDTDFLQILKFPIVAGDTLYTFDDSWQLLESRSMGNENLTRWPFSIEDDEHVVFYVWEGKPRALILQKFFEKAEERRWNADVSQGESFSIAPAPPPELKESPRIFEPNLRGRSLGRLADGRREVVAALGYYSYETLGFFLFNWDQRAYTRSFGSPRYMSTSKMLQDRSGLLIKLRLQEGSGFYYLDFNSFSYQPVAVLPDFESIGERLANGNFVFSLWKHNILVVSPNGELLQTLYLSLDKVVSFFRYNHQHNRLYINALDSIAIRPDGLLEESVENGLEFVTKGNSVVLSPDARWILERKSIALYPVAQIQNMVRDAWTGEKRLDTILNGGWPSETWSERHLVLANGTAFEVYDLNDMSHRGTIRQEDRRVPMEILARVIDGREQAADIQWLANFPNGTWPDYHENDYEFKPGSWLHYVEGALDPFLSPLNGRVRFGTWEDSEWLGLTDLSTFPWVHNWLLGWIYIGSTNPRQTWFYLPEIGWLFVNATQHSVEDTSYYYSHERGTWLYMYPQKRSDTERTLYFADSSHGRWIENLPGPAPAAVSGYRWVLRPEGSAEPEYWTFGGFPSNVLQLNLRGRAPLGENNALVEINLDAYQVAWRRIDANSGRLTFFGDLSNLGLLSYESAYTFTFSSEREGSFEGEVIFRKYLEQPSKENPAGVVGEFRGIDRGTFSVDP